ncbi:hypothetical protein JCM3766R1_001424 [Sporobolomyces carnicolor]
MEHPSSAQPCGQGHAGADGLGGSHGDRRDESSPSEQHTVDHPYQQVQVPPRPVEPASFHRSFPPNAAPTPSSASNGRGVSNSFEQLALSSSSSSHTACSRSTDCDRDQPHSLDRNDDRNDDHQSDGSDKESDGHGQDEDLVSSDERRTSFASTASTSSNRFYLGHTPYPYPYQYPYQPLSAAHVPRHTWSMPPGTPFGHVATAFVPSPLPLLAPRTVPNAPPTSYTSAMQQLPSIDRRPPLPPLPTTFWWNANSTANLATSQVPPPPPRTAPPPAPPALAPASAPTRGSLLPPAVAAAGPAVQPRSRRSEKPSNSYDISPISGLKPFVTKLRFMLTNAREFEDVVRWSPYDGESVLVDFSNPRLAQDVLPRVFNHSNPNGFRAQFTNYGFVQLKDQALELALNGPPRRPQTTGLDDPDLSASTSTTSRCPQYAPVPPHAIANLATVPPTSPVALSSSHLAHLDPRPLAPPLPLSSIPVGDDGDDDRVELVVGTEGVTNRDETLDARRDRGDPEEEQEQGRGRDGHNDNEGVDDEAQETVDETVVVRSAADWKAFLHRHTREDGWAAAALGRAQSATTTTPDLSSSNLNNPDHEQQPPQGQEEEEEGDEEEADVNWFRIETMDDYDLLKRLKPIQRGTGTRGGGGGGRKRSRTSEPSSGTGGSGAAGAGGGGGGGGGDYQVVDQLDGGTDDQDVVGGGHARKSSKTVHSIAAGSTTGSAPLSSSSTSNSPATTTAAATNDEARTDEGGAARRGTGTRMIGGVEVQKLLR